MRPSGPSHCRLRIIAKPLVPFTRAVSEAPLASFPCQCLRFLHNTRPNLRRHRSKYPSVTQNELEALAAVRQKKAQKAQASLTPYTQYTDDELTNLAKKYSPEQMASIKAGEEAVTTYDIATQGALRRDPLQFQYLDDFSRIEQTIDKKIEKIRGVDQDYRETDSLPYFMSDLWFEENRKLSEAEELADLENCGEWVPAPGKDADNTPNETKGIFANLILKRSTAQIGKSALKKYLGVATFKEAKEHCEKIDEQNWLKTIASETPQASPRLYPSSHIPEDPRQPVHSEHFQTAILHDPKYKECYQWAKDNPPPKTAFGMPATEALEDELLYSLPDVAPAIPKLEDPVYMDESEADDAADGATQEQIESLEGISDEELESFQAMARQLGISVQEIRRFRYKVLSSHRVVNQTTLGKMQSQYVLTVAGNEKGMLGVGEGKSVEAPKARTMARLQAIKNMVPILRYENRTIFGEVRAKVGASDVSLGARRPGFGVRGSRHVFEMAKCAGIYDLGAKCRRSRNSMNVAKAIWQALRSQKHPEDIARARGKKLVDLRKVYYSAKV